MQLRPYQEQAFYDLRWEFGIGNRSVLLVCPTGGGKTIIAARVIESAYEKGSRVQFLAHRRELIYQCANKLERFGVDHGIIMAGEFVQMAFEVQVVSIQTLLARAMNTDKMPMPRTDLIVIDEAHRALAPTYRKIIAHYPKAIVLGLTATPIRSDGKGLGHMFDSMVQCPSVMELIRMGYLVPPRHFAPTIPDLTGVPVARGDYKPEELEQAMLQRTLVGDILTHWHKYSRDRQTVVFASGVKHSMFLRDEFKLYTDRVAHLDGETPLTERQQIIRDLSTGALQVVCNYGVMTEGYDEPRLSSCIVARPTKSAGLWLQMAGRVLRPCEAIGKRDSLIIDHSGNVYEHGYVDSDQDWVLEEGRALESSREQRQQEFDERKPITCTECGCVYESQLMCPSCGHIPERKGRYVETRHGELIELRCKERERKRERQGLYTPEEKEMWHRMLLGYVTDRGHSRGYAYHLYKQKFKEEPFVGISVLPMPPSNEVASWCRGMWLRHIKRLEKQKSNEAASAG